MLIFAVRGYRKARAKSGKAVGIIVGVVALLLFVTGLGSIVTDPQAARNQKDFQNHQYTEVRGKITHLTESTLMAGNPAATFEVAGHVFAYGRGSENYELDMVEKGGFLTNKLPVKIWFKDNKILRVSTAAEESKMKGVEQPVDGKTPKAPQPPR